MGNQKSKSKTDVFTEAITSVILSQTNNCIAQTVSNIMSNIRAKNIIITNDSITNIVSVMMNCTGEFKTDNELIDKIVDKIKETAEQEGVAILSGIGGSEQKVEVKIKNIVSTSINQTQVQNCVSKASTNILFNIFAEDTVIIENVNIDNEVNNTAYCVSSEIMNNLIKNGVFDYLDIHTKQTDKDPIEDFFKGIGEMFSGLFSFLTGPIKYIVIGFVVLMAIIIIAFVIHKMFKSNPAPIMMAPPPGIKYPGHYQLPYEPDSISKIPQSEGVPQYAPFQQPIAIGEGVSDKVKEYGRRLAHIGQQYGPNAHSLGQQYGPKAINFIHKYGPKGVDFLESMGPEVSEFLPMLLI